MEKSRKPAIRFKGFTGEWELRKFEDMATRNSATAVCSSELPSVEYEDIISGQGILNKDIREKQNIKTGIRFESDDVLFGKLRPYLRNWILPDFSGVAVGDFWVLHPSETDSQYLYYLIQTPAFQTAANQSTGTKMPRSDWNLVSKTVFLSPKEIAEQRIIGATLQSIDALIALHERKCERLQNVKKSMLEKMFPKKGSNVPEIRFAGFSEPWEMRKLGEIALVKDSARISNSLWVDAGVPYIRASDLSNDNLRGVLFLSLETYELYKKQTGAPSEGDVLFNGGGEIGKAVLILDKSPIYVQGGAVLYAKTSESEFLNGQYLKSFFETERVHSYIDSVAAGGTLKHFTLKPAQELPIIYPSLTEQRQIGSYFENLDTLITLHQREIEKLKNIKKSMLEKLFV